MAEAIKAEAAPGFVKRPDHVVEMEASPRRVRVEAHGQTLADSTGALLLRESNHVPVYYFPREDVRMDLLTRTDHHTYCPFKGEATYYTVHVGAEPIENAVWSYESPYLESMEIKEYLAFYWNKMDHWYEEDEEIFVHPRDPKKRVDTVVSHRPVEVILGGETVAKSSNSIFLFETHLPTRYYLPKEDVRMDLLTPTESKTSCPYKGDAIYWSAEIGGKVYEDIAWSYPDPVPECPKIKDLICFYNENVDEIRVDGETVPKTKTKWSRNSD